MTSSKWIASCLWYTASSGLPPKHFQKVEKELVGICALGASVPSFISIYSFSSLSAPSDRFPTLSTSLGHPDPLVPLPGPPGAPSISHTFPERCGAPCGTSLHWVSCWQTHRGQLTRAHPIHPLAETTALGMVLLHPDNGVKEVGLTHPQNSV